MILVNKPLNYFNKIFIYKYSIKKRGKNLRKTIMILVILVLISSVAVSIYAKKIDPIFKEDSLPSYFSWRDINGTDYTTSIKNQAPAPTCEAYGLCAALETKMQYQMREIYEPDLSETHLYFYAGGTYAKGYVDIVDAANYLVTTGVPDEGCYPDPHRAYDYPFESLPGWENRTVKITNWGWVEHDEEAIKKALIEHGPLVICVHFWKDFYYYHNGVYKHRWGKRAGGHVMAMVGYDDRERCWIVKNSWGTKWGDNGWVKISYDIDMFAEWYGNGTGIMYLGEVYGNLKPDVPRVQIEKPENFKTYLFGREFKTIFRLKNFHLQLAAPRILGKLKVEVNAENTNKVEFYIDGELKHVDNNAPYEWNLEASSGLHTLDVLAYNDHNMSKDTVDILVFT
ncbi:MAG: hypothetical protein DRN24_03420 [Thermoplasmata archaeon]|nr:MAG: hypothetical protein DRN24_03420 [Thermoplasmata archaeon]